jgi:hypothetical protein
MDYREHPRTAAAEPRHEGAAGDPGARSRFRRFEFRRPERQLDLPRVLLASLILLGLLSAAGYLGIQAARSAVRWLHGQPQYQVAFGAIHLHPAPPSWFRGGIEGFLSQVRERSREPEILPVLDLDPDRLRRAFQDYSPWVEEVVRIATPPHEIHVELVYKKPVAVQESGPGEEAFLLDRNGHLLPGEDVDRDRLGPLIRITGQHLTPSTENRPGGIWKSGLAGAEAARIEAGVRGAAALAGFFQDPERLTDQKGTPALQVLSIFASDPHRRGLFLRTADGVQVLWGEPPGKEASGTLTAVQKWDLLRRWAALPSRRELVPGGYWSFSRNELRPVEPAAGRS